MFLVVICDAVAQMRKVPCELWSRMMMAKHVAVVRFPLIFTGMRTICI
jgi:hypothetical protein